MSYYTGPLGRGGEGGPPRKRVGSRRTWFTELGKPESWPNDVRWRWCRSGAPSELMWSRYRESRYDAFADNAFLVFSACPVITVHEQITESASSRGISGSKAKRHYQMDTYAWITRHKTTLRTVFNSEGYVRGLARRKRRKIAPKFRQLT
jgi:hypothetical protein